MNRILVFLISMLALAGWVTSPLSAKADTNTTTSLATQDREAEIERSRAAIALFSASLKSELKKAMLNGGALNAIDVCSTSAIPITEGISLQQGMQLSRVSLRNRNSKNAPSGWQIKVLEQFDTRARSGENPSSINWSDVSQQGDNPEFRYMQAIPTAAICLQCHGSSIPPEVKTRLQQLYPEDKATAYSEGDIRGAFVVTHEVSD